MFGQDLETVSFRDFGRQQVSAYLSIFIAHRYLVKPTFKNFQSFITLPHKLNNLATSQIPLIGQHASEKGGGEAVSLTMAISGTRLIISRPSRSACWNFSSFMYTRLLLFRRAGTSFGEEHSIAYTIHSVSYQSLSRD